MKYALVELRCSRSQPYPRVAHSARHAPDASTDTFDSVVMAHNFYDCSGPYTPLGDCNRELARLALLCRSPQHHICTARVSTAVLGRNDAEHLSSSSRTSSGVFFREDYSVSCLVDKESRG